LLFDYFLQLYFRFFHAIIPHKFEADSLSYHKFDVSFQFPISKHLDFACNFPNFYEAYQSILIIFHFHAYSFILVWQILFHIHLSFKLFSDFTMTFINFHVWSYLVNLTISRYSLITLNFPSSISELALITCFFHSRLALALSSRAPIHTQKVQLWWN
jgi:hypothetical protein